MIDPTAQIEQYKALDAALESWRQGDCIIGPFGFIVRINPALPIKQGDRSEVSDSDLYEEDVEGLVVLTQTCDIVRKSSDRPYVEVGPLVRVKDKAELAGIKKGTSPQYAYLPGVADRMLIADLDRSMTIEKGLLAVWTRETGCPTDQDQRDFAEALARKRARFAFPDDFISLIAAFRARIMRKHSKDSPEGVYFRSLREIRITAAPQWDYEKISLMFWFIVIEGTDPSAEALRKQCDAWMDCIKPGCRFSTIDYNIVNLDDISAREYLSSDRLDLDHLSKSMERRP